ncbi:type II toxin-antitoxin system Phd/YefM family antitoxin [Dankookia sp. GCM10030260]|uniref:type II toxin-antitoxin system Phd/YefM family antitoxin n=1 Tax=Dankookia sp. GCM10030260 TaxID=3273390 RepID=UPI003622BC9B
MSDAVTIHAAKTHLSALVARAEAGEEIIIARGNTPVAKLVPLVPPAAAPDKRRTFGIFRGLIEVGDEALDDWTEEELSEWEEGHPGDPLRNP